MNEMKGGGGGVKEWRFSKNAHRVEIFLNDESI